MPTPDPHTSEVRNINSALPGRRDAFRGETARPVDTAVVVPIKSFALAKGRLADALSGPERAELARLMAATVVEAAGTIPVFVATDDRGVAAWAVERGRPLLDVSVTGLNAVATQVVEMLSARGFRYAMICHADLPLARDLDAVAGFPGVTIVPDRHGDGTNVIVVPTASGFRFHYGPGSAHRHRYEAARLGLSLRWLRLPHLAWDIDVPDDLDVFGQSGNWAEASSTSPGSTPRNNPPNAWRPAP